MRTLFTEAERQWTHLLPQIQTEVAAFVQSINNAAADGNSDLVAEYMGAFSEFFAQSVIDGMRAGRMHSVHQSPN